MHIKTAITVVLTLFLSLSNISNAQGLDWGQDIRWTASLENAKKNKTKASRKVIVKVDLRKSPFRKVEKVVTKIDFFDVKGISVRIRE